MGFYPVQPRTTKLQSITDGPLVPVVAWPHPELLHSHLPDTDPLSDKVYVTGRLTFTNPGQITLTVDAECPPVFLNSKYVPEFMPTAPTVTDITNGQVPGLSLVSGGLFVVLHKPNGKRLLLTLRRDANEEIIAMIQTLAEPQSRVDLLVFHSEAGLTPHWNSRKENQYHRQFAPVTPNHPQLSTRCIPLASGVPAWTCLPQTRLTLQTPYFTHDYLGYAWFDEAHNTLGFRRFVEISLKPGESFAFKDAEDFCREPVFVPMPAENPWGGLTRFGPLTPILEHLSQG